MKSRCVKCRKPVEQPETGRRRLTCSAACRQALWRKRNRGLRTTLEIMGSSRSDDWPTDPAVFAALDAKFGPFTLDPCSSAENAKCPRFFTRDDDGLAQEWTGRVYVNPPYGRHGGGIKAWMQKAYEASQSTAEIVVCLVPSRTGSSWFQDWAMRGEVRFLRGRLKFGELKNSAPFDSAVVVFRNASAVTEQADFAEVA